MGKGREDGLLVLGEVKVRVSRAVGLVESCIARMLLAAALAAATSSSTLWCSPSLSTLSMMPEMMATATTATAMPP